MTADGLKVGVIPAVSDRLVHPDHPLSLAYLGDAVWELYARHYLLARGFTNPHDLQRRSVSYVSAKAQAAVLDRLMPQLTEAERDIVRRGRNAKAKTIPRNTPVHTYRHSTAAEALIGHLYATDQLARLTQLMAQAFEMAETAHD